MKYFSLVQKKKNLNHSFSPVCKEVEISLFRYNSNRGSSDETSVEESFGTASPEWKHTTDLITELK